MRRHDREDVCQRLLFQARQNPIEFPPEIVRQLTEALAGLLLDAARSLANQIEGDRSESEDHK